MSSINGTHTAQNSTASQKRTRKKLVKLIERMASRIKSICSRKKCCFGKPSGTACCKNVNKTKITQNISKPPNCSKKISTRLCTGGGGQPQSPKTCESGCFPIRCAEFLGGSFSPSFGSSHHVEELSLKNVTFRCYQRLERPPLCVAPSAQILGGKNPQFVDVQIIGL